MFNYFHQLCVCWRFEEENAMLMKIHFTNNVGEENEGGVWEIGQS